MISGRVPAGRLTRLACQRHVKDLARKRYPYVFEPDLGAKVCRFIEHLSHTKGRWAARGERIVLEPWQCFLVVVLFGWVNKKTRRRRFRSAYWEIPRKNGKSILGAAIGLYMLMADGEYGAEVYSGATTEKQAWEVFRPARLMLEKDESLREALGASVYAKSLAVEANGSRFEPIIGDPGDGASPSCAIVDEYHEHATSSLYDTMETGMIAREQPLILAITTAGYNIAGPCHEKRDQVVRMLEGTVAREELFGCIFCADPDDDWSNPKTLAKANPNFGVSADSEILLAMQRSAMRNPTEQNKFKTKHLNIWTSVLAGVINMQWWAECGDPMLEEEELAGCDCVVAGDLASKVDLCAEARLYWRDLGGKRHYYAFGSYWLPEEAIEEPGPNEDVYRKWVIDGLLTQTDGATVDFEQITETIIEDCKRMNPHEAVFDPYNAIQMMQALQKKKITTVEFVQNPANFAVPLDELLAAVKDRRFHHDCNEMTTWCMSNLVARPTRKGLIAPTKQKPHQKIDGAIAVIMAIARAMTERKPTRNYRIFVPT